MGDDLTRRLSNPCLAKALQRYEPKNFLESIFGYFVFAYKIPKSVFFHIFSKTEK